MDFHFLVMEKSWKINVEKEGAPSALHNANAVAVKEALNVGRVGKMYVFDQYLSTSLVAAEHCFKRLSDARY